MSKRALAAMAPHLLEPFSIGCFRFTATGVDVVGRPSFSETQSAFDFVTRSVKSGGFWMVDMITYIESRTDFGDKRDALISVETGLTEGTVSVYRSIGKSVPPENRVEGVSFGHHMVVSKLEGQEQVEWLERSKDEGWTRQELRSEIRAKQRLNMYKGQAPGIYAIEVVLFLDVESGTVLKAEALAQGAVERMLKVLEAPVLTARVHAVRPR